MDDKYKATETVNEETGKPEIKVDTVNYVSPPGDDKEPKKQDVKITHQFVEGDVGEPGVIQKGVAAVGRATDSAKELMNEAIASAGAGAGTKSDKPTATKSDTPK